jgi:hypothetical protein
MDPSRHIMRKKQSKVSTSRQIIGGTPIFSSSPSEI